MKAAIQEAINQKSFPITCIAPKGNIQQFRPCVPTSNEHQCIFTEGKKVLERKAVLTAHPPTCFSTVGISDNFIFEDEIRLCSDLRAKPSEFQISPSTGQSLWNCIGDRVRSPVNTASNTWGVSNEKGDAKTLTPQHGKEPFNSANFTMQPNSDLGPLSRSWHLVSIQFGSQHPRRRAKNWTSLSEKLQTPSPFC